jgi:hypothetical protein
MEAAQGRIDVGRVLGETFSIYGSQASVLLGIAGLIFAAVGAIQGLLAAAGGLFLVLGGAAVSLIGTTLYTGFVVKLVEDVRDGRRDFTVGELFSSATGAVAPLIGNGVLKGIAVAIGFVLLIVPGLILLTIWAVTAPVIVVERRGVIDAFGRSRDLVRGEGWSVFAVILIAYLINFAIGFAAGALGDASGDAGRYVLPVIGNIVVAPIIGLVAAVLFFDLGGGSRAAAEGTAGAAPGGGVTP